MGPHRQDSCDSELTVSLFPTDTSQDSSSEGKTRQARRIESPRRLVSRVAVGVLVGFLHRYRCGECSRCILYESLVYNSPAEMEMREEEAKLAARRTTFSFSSHADLDVFSFNRRLVPKTQRKSTRQYSTALSRTRP